MDGGVQVRFGSALFYAILLSPLAAPMALAQTERSAPAAESAPTRVPADEVFDELERIDRERHRDLLGKAPEVTWADVLRDPDNLALNVAYARTQLARGDLKSASATLERILLIAPGAPQVQLLHGLVLYRLREYGGAERELSAALTGELSDEQRTQAERVLSAIAEAQRRTRLTLTLGGGLRYDDNREQEPLGGSRLVLGAPVDANPEHGDTAVVTLARARLSHELDNQDGDLVFGEAAYYGADQLRDNNLDLRVFGARVGMTLYFGSFTLTPRAGADLVRLEDQNYMTAVRGEARLDWQLLPDFDPFVEFGLADENFDDVSAAPSGEDRTGLRRRLAVGFNWQILPRVSLAMTGERQVKEAREDYEGYHGYALRVAPLLVLDHGQFLRGDFIVRRRDYFGPDAVVSSETRGDTDYVAGVSYGAPLSFFASPLPPLARALEDVRILVTLEQERNVSNIPNYDFLSHRAQFLITRSFRF